MSSKRASSSKTSDKKKVKTEIVVENIDEFDEEVEKIDLEITKSIKKSNKTKGDSNKKRSLVQLSDSEEDEKPKKKKSAKKSKSYESSDESDVKPAKSKSKKESKSKESKSSKPSKSKETKPVEKVDYDNIEKPKVKKSKIVRGEDPSSLIKCASHPHPFVYNGQTYYCTFLPQNFQAQWDGICEMRRSNDAPVDTMGAGKLTDKNVSPATARFQTLISCMISSQTKDEVTAKSMDNLRAIGLTIDNMIETPEDEIKRCIYKCSFNQKKAVNIKKIAYILRDYYNGDVPREREEIESLPGCGVKVSNLAMWFCHRINCGIAVDTHMERIIGDRLKWTESKTYDKIMKELETWMPKVMWPEVNDKLVGFGQTICSSQKPKCNECLIKNHCDYYATMF